jgi:hypothetical protein
VTALRLRIEVTVAARTRDGSVVSLDVPTERELVALCNRTYAPQRLRELEDEAHRPRLTEGLVRVWSHDYRGSQVVYKRLARAMKLAVVLEDLGEARAQAQTKWSLPTGRPSPTRSGYHVPRIHDDDLKLLREASMAQRELWVTAGERHRVAALASITQVEP